MAHGLLRTGVLAGILLAVAQAVHAQGPVVDGGPPGEASDAPEEPVRLVLLQPLDDGDAVDIGSFASVLRSQLPSETTVRIVPARPDTRDDPARLRWGVDLAHREDARAVLWLEPDPEASRLTLFVVDRHADPPRVESITSREAREFDRLRVLAIAARTMLKEVEAAAEEPADPEPEAPADEPTETRTASPEPSPSSTEPPPDAARPTPAAEPDPRPETPPSPDEETRAVVFHGLTGAALRLGTGRAVPAWRTVVGLRWRFLVLRTGFSLLGEESLNTTSTTEETSRRRLPVELGVLAHLEEGRWHLAVGPRFSVVPVAGTVESPSGPGTPVDPTSPDSSTRELRAIGLTAGATASIALQMTDYLFLELHAGVDGRVAEPKPLDLAGADAVPPVEATVGLSLGAGRP